MEFIQQNKFFSILLGLCVLALIVLWPSIFGLGPPVVRFHRARYEAARMGLRSLQPKMDKIFPKDGKGVPIKQAVRAVESSNATLQSNLDEVTAWMSFVPRHPFRIPATRQADDERRSYVSLAYTYARTGELLCPEYTIKDPTDGVVFQAGTRNIPLRDPYFGTLEMYTPPAIKDPEARIMQVALIHELGHLAIRFNPDELTSIVPAEPYKVKLGETDIATAYPLTVKFRADLSTLLAFLHALDGAHGRVVRPTAPEEPEEAIKPLAPPPRRRPGPADDPDDPGPAPAPPEAVPALPAPPALPDAPRQTFQLRLTGSPSYLAPDAAQGTLKERFTIFRRDPGNPQNFTFVANAIATKVLDPGNPRLVPASILDWRGLCSKLNSLRAASEPSFARRLWQFLSPAAQKAAEEIAEGHQADDARQADLLAGLNSVLAARRDLYRAEDFPTPPANEAEALLKLDRQALSSEQVHRLNRLLLEAAFPQEVARMAVVLEAAVEPGSDRPAQPEGKEPIHNVVKDGDFASTRYFLVRSIKLKSNPGAIKFDKDNYPSDLTPPHLEVDLSVAAITFLQVQAIKVKEQAPALGERVLIPRGL